MKKFFLTLFLSLIFLLVSCSGKNASDLADSIDTDSTDTTADTSDTNVSDTDTTDTGNSGNEISDTDTTDTENQDIENQDTETSDNEISDTEASDTDILDTDTSDSDTSDSDTTDTDSPDTDVSDSDTSDTSDSDIADTDNSDSDISDSDTSDSDISDSDTSDSDTSDSDTSDSDITDTDNSDTDSSDSDACDNIDVFNKGPYEVTVTDIASGTDGAPRDFRIYEPADISGSIPVVHFQHDFLYKKDYYDNVLTHLASHGFIVVSGKSDHAKVNGQSSITEAQKVVSFISWLKEHIQSKVSVTADVENFGIAGHGRGGKVSSRVTNYNEMTMLKGFFGVDPVDSTQSSSSYDAESIVEITTGAISSKEQCLAFGGTWSLGSCRNATIDSQEKCEILSGYYFNGSKCYNNRTTLPSMFLGTEKGQSGSSACAPAGENSTDFYASYPSPSRHIIAAGVGHTDMVDPEDLSSCGSNCSGCAGSGNTELNQQFIAYAGGLMTTFFNSTLKGKTQCEALLDDVSQHPFATIINEHK
jgi:hypothetical protein